MGLMQPSTWAEFMFIFTYEYNIAQCLSSQMLHSNDSPVQNSSHTVVLKFKSVLFVEVFWNKVKWSPIDV